MEYPKIQSVYFRDPATNFKTFLMDQWAKEEFGYLRDLDWIWTEKVDGTNVRIVWEGASSVRFAGKTDNASLPPFLLDYLRCAFTTAYLAKCFDGPAILYGEGYGAKIQKGGGLYRSDVGFILFDVFCGDVWLTRESVEDIAKKMFIPVVPIAGVGTLVSAVDLAKEGFKSLIAQAREAEGLVMRPAFELRDRNGHRIITKVKRKDFAIEAR